MLLIFLSVALVSGAAPFDIRRVEVVWSPPDCGNISLVILVHSHPAHRELRSTLRRTWARPVSQNSRTVFVIGNVQEEELSDRLHKERLEHNDILRGDFLDSYRNLTYKHLLGYSWLTEHCQTADYVLKTDDDQFVDTLQLPRYLHTFLPPPTELWFLCNVLQEVAPIRDPDSKWFVSSAEWAGAEYPAYCAGWAYVTTLPTVSRVLAWASLHPYFWIDDLHVTGTLPALHGGIKMYDWVYSFLTTHVQYSQQILEGSFFTPELMVCGDVSARQISHVWSKAERCQARGCSDLVYTQRGHTEAVRPTVRTQGQGQLRVKQEL